MGAHMRAFDWSATALGAPEGWPQTLRACLRILWPRASRCGCGGDPSWSISTTMHIFPIIGAKHPTALGQSARQVWAEIWDQIAQRTAAAMNGEAAYSEAELLVTRRNAMPRKPTTHSHFPRCLWKTPASAASSAPSPTRPTG